MADSKLLDRLPPLRGRLTPQSALSKITWFRVGGPAELLFRPEDLADLQAFLAAKPADIPATVIGVGSNILVRDGGLAGVVIRLARGFNAIRLEGETLIAGAAALDLTVAKLAGEAGRAGLEFLVGVPGTVGGAVRMNAGAYGRETKDCLLWAEALDGKGVLHRLSNTDIGFSYRHSSLPADWIVVRAAFAAPQGDAATIRARMAEIQESRSSTQPIRSRTGGSTFKNPPGEKAWQLIDAAGCRGLAVGDAQVSEQHCNFLINRGEATASDLETLGETVRARVLENSGIALEWEIKRLGQARAAVTADKGALA